MISEKKILQTDLTGAKIVQGNTRNTGTYHGLECWRKSYTVICRGKNSDLTQSISVIHPFKSQMVESFTDNFKIRTPPWRYSKLPAQSSLGYLWCYTGNSNAVLANRKIRCNKSCNKIYLPLFLCLYE